MNTGGHLWAVVGTGENATTRRTSDDGDLTWSSMNCQVEISVK